ncbi:hypothetical protein ACFE04_009415 [Oxalis oulophora]
MSSLASSTSCGVLSISPSSKSTPCSRVLCCARSQPPPPPPPPRYEASNLKLALHDALDTSGVDTFHAREAREGFHAQIKKLSNIERETSISINRRVDLGSTALYIAAEDDSLVSHSSVPLPVDAFLERLDDLSMGYCSHYNSSVMSSREKFLDSLESYLYVKKGFRRTNEKVQLQPRALYLHSVLTHRSGSAVMLSLIYSEMLKMLRLWGLLDFDAEIFFPHDLHGLPRAYDKQKSRESDQAHIMTTQNVLEEALKYLKHAFWPFQKDNSQSLFLRAADAANCVSKSSSIEESAFQLAFSKAAKHRLERGVWTSVRFGDMRRALSACERLVLLGTHPKELRDYSILLYHCGLYEQSLHNLKLYQETKKQSDDGIIDMEEDAVDKLMFHLIVIKSGVPIQWRRGGIGLEVVGNLQIAGLVTSLMNEFYRLEIIASSPLTSVRLHSLLISH